MGLTYIPFRYPGVENVRCLFQMKSADTPAMGDISLEAGGDPLAVRQNRLRITALPGVTAFAENLQVHGVRTVFEPTPQNPEEKPCERADGLATTQPRLALMIKTADCQPLMLAAKNGSAVAALHVGWKGNRQEYPRIAVGEFCERYALKPSEVLAVRGPSLGPTAAQFIHFAAEWGGEYRAWFDESAKTMDLWRLTRDQLVRAGLLPSHVFALDLCTWTMEDSFFSYRRAHQCGRQASLIWME